MKKQFSLSGKRKTKTKKEEQEEQQEAQPEAIDLTEFLSALEKPELRVTGIYGGVEEERCSETIYGLLALHTAGQTSVPEDPEVEDSPMVTTYKPIDFYVSTYGGSAAEMFAVYDVMRTIRDKSPIRTHGVGKVMSAGVLMLAAGTKGERRIGKYCRVMIHGVVAGQHGHIADVENEFEETKHTQKMYIKALAEETNMTEKYLRNLVSKKTNVYIDAEEAVNLGIADIIV